VNRVFYLFVVLLFVCAVAPMGNMLAILFGYSGLFPEVRNVPERSCTVVSAPATSLDACLKPEVKSVPEATDAMPRMGQMGDFFGGHTAAFSGLLSACVIIHFSLQQLKIAKQTADLTSISKIYDHYSEEYSNHGQGKNEILSAIARGHRRWAIRESFSIIDPDSALEGERSKQVDSDFEQLIELSADPENVGHYTAIALLCGSLLLDKRLLKVKRVALWALYETLRREAATLHDSKSQGVQTLASNLRRLHRRFHGGFSW
jgi:hypothetical protein